ncbi:PEP-CTERM sorting domain-containing protein [Methylobacillus caricis]|uniref:PEP-CTERM sorting domain-containing protein n=1 Tax=Methylobacillus caricis TaxID=1971611 RepID=UPI001CFFCC97|nr:PEP-CTERM sorting domain-containing protein [Methylobacillus caricis]MCB5188566.1 PEP-CTERM sorting domain-containing protein [Methylobacillus caricis]
MKFAYTKGILVLSLLATASFAQAATATSEYFTNVADSLSTDGFNQLIATRLGSGTTGVTAITNGVVSNAPAGDAELTRTSGTAYPASFGLYEYMGPYSTFTVSDSTVISDLGSIVFQSHVNPGGNYSLGGAGGIDAAISDVFLSFNGGSQLLSATTFSLTDAIDNPGSPFYDPSNPVVEAAIGYFTWDLSGISDPITSYSISFGTHAHSSIIAFQVDQIAAAVPEPSAYALMLGGLALVGFAARRKKG